MLVCHNRAAAIAYQKAFLQLKEQGLNSFDTKVIMSFNTKKDPKEYLELAVNEEDKKTVIENFKLPFTKETPDGRFENEADILLGGKKQYDNTAILIVSDML